ncbi:MAG: carboxypeptidase-like regulatory domain-containing protein [Isosphaeraceae bacterium]
MSDVEILLAAWIRADGSVPTLARGTTDGRGAFRLEVARQRLKGIGFIRLIWAYSPGHGVAIEQIDLTENGGLPPIQLTLAKPFPRTLSILGPDDRPLAGVRLAPVLSAINGRALFFTPDDWLDRFTVATGADGLATLPYLPATVDPLLLRVAAPGIVSHNLSLPYRPGSDRITLKLGRPARLSGSITNDSGQPASDVSVEVWAENAYQPPTNPVGNRKATLQPILIRFDSGPVGTQADGSFLTPAQLLTGTSYRVVIRREGSPLAASDWLTATTDVTTIPPFRLRQVRKLVGQALDREGGPIVGARVFLPSGEPSTTTDSQGRFVLEGILPDRTYLLVQARGFRLRGWPAIPARQAEERKYTLVRTSDPPDRTMAPLSAPISAEESRALARRVLDPYLKTVLEKGDESTRMQCLRTLSAIDPTEVLELLEKGTIQNVGWADSLRITVAKDRFAGDPPGAESTVEAISGPVDRAIAYLRLASALPASDRDGKRRLFDRASPLLRATEGGRGNAKGSVPIFAVGELAGGWLDLGEVEKARALISEGFRSVEALPPPQRYQFANFLATAARIDLDRVLTLVKEITIPRRRQSCLGEIAASLANEHPDDAERVFQLLDDRLAAPPLGQKTNVALRLCQRMAKTETERVRRIIAGLKAPGEQACAWALRALALADRDKPASRSALNESIQAIDLMLDQLGASGRQTSRILVAINPAASILPIVEKVAPERVEEVFWRAVALMPKSDPARDRFLDVRQVALSAIFLARYDRQVAAALTTQTDQALQSPPRGSIGPVLFAIRAKVEIDPRGAVTIIEALPPGGPDPRHPTNQARTDLATCLAESPEARWKTAWSISGVDLD